MSSISPHNETNTTPNISIATPTPNAAPDVHAPVAADAEEASVEQQRFQKLRATTPIFADSSTDNTKGTAAPNATANVSSEQRDEEEEAEQQRVTAGVRDRVAVAVLSPMDIETEAEGHHETKDGGSGIVPSSAATAQQQSLQQQQQPYVCPTPSATPSKGRRATSTYKTAKDVMGGNVKNSDFGIGDRNAPPEISADGGGGEGGGGAPASNTHSSGSSRPGIFSRILSIINRVMPSSPVVISSGPQPIHFKRLDLSDVTPATFLFDSDKANRNSALAHRHTADGTEAVVAAHHPSDAANEASQMSTATPKKQRRSPRSAAATPQKGGVPSMTKGTNNNAFLGPNAHHQPYHQMNPYAPNGPSPWQNQQPHPHPGDPNFFAPYANSYANPYLQQQQQGYPPYMMGVPQGAGGGMFAMYPSQQGALAGSTRKSSANAALFGAAPPPPPGYAEATTPSQGVASLRRRSRAASINLSRNEEGGAPVANEESADTATPPVEAVVSRNPSKCVSRSIMGHAHKTPLASRAPSPNGSYRAGVGAASQHNENSSAILNAESGGNAHQNGEAANPSTPPPPSYNNAAEAVAINNSNNKAAAPSSTMRLSLAALQQHMPHSTAMAAGSGSFTPASRRSVAVAGHPSPASYQNTPHSAMYRLPLSQQQAQQAAAILDSNTLSMMMGHAISNNNSFANSNYNSHASTPQHHSHAGGGGSGAASAPAAAYCSHCGSSTPTAMQQQQQQLPLQRQAALMPPPPPPQMPLRSSQPRPQQQQQWLGPAVLPPPTHIARQPYSNNSSINNAFVAAPPPFPPMQQQPYGFGAAPIASAPFAAKGSVLPQQPFYGHTTNQNYFGGGHNNYNNNSGGGVGYGYGGGGSGFGSGPAAFPLHQQGMMMQTTAEPPLSHNKYGFLRRMKTRAYKDHQKELEADLEEEGEAQQQQQFFLQ